MESSSSSSRIADESLNQKQSCMANQLLSNRLIVLLPVSIPQYTFAPSSLFSRKSICSSNNPNLKALFTTTKTIILHNFQSSIVPAVDKCLRFFHQFDSHNPFFSKVSSLSSGFHNFCQIHRREYRNLNSLSNHNFAAILPGDSVAGIVVANGLLNFFNIYNTLLVCRLVLTWFPNSPPAIVSPLSTLCDPYLNIFRGLIPPLGGTLDLSPILAFLVLNAFTSAASALPAELPPVGISQGIASSSTELSNLTTSQKKWMRRFATNRSKNSSNDI